MCATAAYKKDIGIKKTNKIMYKNNVGNGNFRGDATRGSTVTLIFVFFIVTY